MKVLLNVLAVCCLMVVIGCSSSETVAPAAMAECGPDCMAACCAAKSECCKSKADASMGAVGESGCCKDKAKSDASMGAVSESNCASKCSGAARTCPMTGKKIDG